MITLYWAAEQYKHSSTTQPSSEIAFDTPKKTTIYINRGQMKVHIEAEKKTQEKVLSLTASYVHIILFPFVILFLLGHKVYIYLVVLLHMTCKCAHHQHRIHFRLIHYKSVFYRVKAKRAKPSYMKMHAVEMIS